MYSQAFAMERVTGGSTPSPCRAPVSEAGPRIIVLDVARKLLETTAAARIMLTDGVVLRRCFGQLATATRADAARLDTALKLTATQGVAHAIFDGDGQSERIEADLIAVSHEDDSAGHVVMILKPALEGRRQRLNVAQDQFGLTRAESRLLAALFEGCSVPQAALRLGVARSTARTHLQRVFDKTGARRQGDLLRLVAGA